MNHAVQSYCLLLSIAITAGVCLAQDAEPKPTADDAPTVVPPGEQLTTDRPAFFVNVQVDRPDGRYRGGDTLTVSFQLERDAYAWLLYHQADGSTVMLFPNKAHPDNALKARQEVTLPSDPKKYRFRIRPPFGEEALQVIASKEPLGELTALDTSKGRAVVVPEESLAKLADRVASGAGNIAEHRVRLHTSKGDAPLRPPRKPKRVALCFGPSKFKHPDQIKAFPRYRNAPLLMRELFVKHGGIDPKDVRVLIDEQSTRANFKQGVTQWLPSITEPGDTVFIFFHGHGGPVENRDGSETDGCDEFLTTYDHDLGAVKDDPVASIHKTDVVDDALARWLQELPGRQIVLLLDTCYGGGLTDSVRRSIARFGHDEIQRVGDVTELNTVVLSAGLPDEVTFSPKGNSYLALALAKLAEEGKRPVTMRRAYEYFVAYLKGIQGPQGPLYMRFAQEPVMTHNALLDIYLYPKK